MFDNDMDFEMWADRQRDLEVEDAKWRADVAKLPAPLHEKVDLIFEDGYLWRCYTATYMFRVVTSRLPVYYTCYNKNHYSF